LLVADLISRKICYILDESCAFTLANKLKKFVCNLTIKNNVGEIIVSLFSCAKIFNLQETLKLIISF